VSDASWSLTDGPPPTDVDPDPATTVTVLTAEVEKWKAHAGRAYAQASLREIERDQAVAALAQAHRTLADVEKLHAPVRMHPEFRFKPWCGHCSTGIVTHSDDGSFTHRVYWPCATATALGMTDPLAPSRSGAESAGEQRTYRMMTQARKRGLIRAWHPNAGGVATP
jgi:hypothetical protein